MEPEPLSKVCRSDGEPEVSRVEVTMNLKPKPPKKFPSPGELLILNNNGEHEPLLGFSSSFDDVFFRFLSYSYSILMNEAQSSLKINRRW